MKRRYLRKVAGGEIVSLRQSTLMLIMAITIHNIPEGMAVGLAFALALSDAGNPALFSGALALALGIGIQNYPEGTAVALPCSRTASAKRKLFHRQYVRCCRTCLRRRRCTSRHCRNPDDASASGICRRT